jgi:hypothetical protein
MDPPVPVVTGNYEPFRLVLREDHDVWEPTLEEINKRTYDYVKLHRLSTYIDVGIRPFSMAVCFDGTLALPAIEQYHDPERALTTFNKTLCEALVGGLYCEAMSPDDICLGHLTLTAYCTIGGANRGRVSGFHKAIRSKHLGCLDAIHLLNPETTTHREFEEAITVGRQRLALVGPATPETLLYGATFFARNQWPESLLHLWTSAEQIVNATWADTMVGSSRVDGMGTRSRRAFLRDTRTWTASTRLEVLFQKGLLPDQTYCLLSKARKARNDFAHEGTLPGREHASAALDGLLQLASLRTTRYEDIAVLDDIANEVKRRSKMYEDWDRRGEPIEGVIAWLALPPVPGNPGWGDEPFEIIEELTLQRFDQDSA